MGQVARTLRIIVSSTFGDLKVQRNVLRDGSLGTVIDCPKEGRRGRMRANPFTVGPPKGS